ncbi:ester cyclase [Actinomycetospora flava]|uniref:Nuclear transport factor 2 family protein n=1 Tax=Actinomycetospora flava TaxID=3129232 RepID=A0ABU8MAS6_9PSEU
MSSASAPDPPRPTPPTDASPGALIRWTIDVLNAHDAEALRQVYAPTIRARFPTRTVRSADDLVAWWRGVFAAVPDLAMTIEGMAENGTRDEGEVFLRWRLAGHHSGAAWEGLEATGAAVDLDGMDHFVVAGGVIASNFVVFDQLQFARQIGLMPAEGSRLDVGLKRGFNALARRRQR